MQRAEIDALVRRYAEGPALLRAAWNRVPEAARQWRPAEGRWSAHEVVVHCADSETNGAGRVRYLLCEAEPLLVGYDQDVWARTLDYHAHPVDLAFAVVDAVRANTAAMLRRQPSDAWTRIGRHTESGPFSAERWLTTYAQHLEVHARQIDRNIVAFAARTP
jgi:hypothetical protein